MRLRSRFHNVCIYVPRDSCLFLTSFHRVTRHHHAFSTISPLWLLPVVTLIVCSSTGQLIAAELMKTSPPHALLTMGMSMVMLFIGLTLAFMIMTLYISRIIIEGFPSIDLIISSFVLLGPCGQGAYSFLIAGQNFQNVLPWGGNVLGMNPTGQIINVVCLIAAFFVWCIGMWWLVMALLAIGNVLLNGHRIPFKLAFWGLVFPNVRYIYIHSHSLFSSSQISCLTIGCSSYWNYSTVYRSRRTTLSGIGRNLRRCCYSSMGCTSHSHFKASFRWQYFPCTLPGGRVGREGRRYRCQ